MAEYRTLCSVLDLPAGESRMFVVEGQMVGLFHVDDEFLAVSNECPHAGASLAHGTFEGETVSNSWNAWRPQANSTRFV